jgi:hypothetical protein
MRQHIHLRDWPFGAVGRRLLLEALLLDRQPENGWTKSALETRADVAAGGLDEVLAGAVSLKLVEQRNGRWYRPDELPTLGDLLTQLVAAAGDIPDEPIPPLSRRPYRRRGRTQARSHSDSSS